MLGKLQAALLSLLVVAFLGVFLLWPICSVVRDGVIEDGRPTLAFIAAVFRNPIYVEGLLNSLAIGLFTTFLATLIALPLALIAARYDFPLKGMLTALLLVPMILPPFVGAIGIRQILGYYGPLNALLIKVGVLGPEGWIDWLGQARLAGVVILEALSLYPVIYLNATAALANIDPTLKEAAQNLGCTGWRRFYRVTLPLMMPGLFAGGITVFIWSFTELGTPLMLDVGRVISVQIYDGIKEIGSDNPFPYALVIVMLAMSLVLYGVSKGLFGRSSHAMLAKAAAGAQFTRARGPFAALLMLPFLGVIGLAILPHVSVLLLSVSSQWYQTVVPADLTSYYFREALGHEMTVPSIANSVQYASLAVIVDVVLGVGVAYVVVRSRLPGRDLLDALAMLPLAVPGMVVAFGYLNLTKQGAPLAWLVGDPLNPDPFLLLIFAYAVRRLPYVVRSCVAGLQQTSVALEEAAANLGASFLTTLRRITLPLIAANLIAGALLAFSFAMLAVSDSLMLAQKAVDYPITKAIYELSQLLGTGRFIAAALGVWAMLFLALTNFGASALIGKKMGAIFRV